MDDAKPKAGRPLGRQTAVNVERDREIIRLYVENMETLASIGKRCGLTRQGVLAVVRRRSGLNWNGTTEKN
jgi:hypothetical protein